MFHVFPVTLGVIAVPSQMDLLFRVALAALCGGAIGFEREFHEKPAGLRTHALVAVGACTFSIAGFGSAFLSQANIVQLDISRIPAQVASGIGFLGAGIIIFHGDRLRGLTTAAELWSVAALGVLIGLGLQLVAVVITVLILLILIGGRPIERAIDRIRIRRNRIERERRLFGRPPLAPSAVGYATDIPLEDEEDAEEEGELDEDDE